MRKIGAKWRLWMLCASLLAGGYLAAGGHSHAPQPQADRLWAPVPRLYRAGHDNGHAAATREQIFYRNGRMTGKLTFWNGQPWERTLFEYLDELSLYRVQTMVYHGAKLSIVRKDLFQSADDDSGQDRKIETWYYHFDKDKANALRQVDTYWPGTTLVKERQLFDESGGLQGAARFEYAAGAGSHAPDENETIPSLTRMTLMNDEGEIVSDYCELQEVDLQRLYGAIGLDEPEVDRRARIAQDPDRIPILVMDGGIDPGHPELAYKMWHNPGEQRNGRDDDGNGLADDINGISDNPRLGRPVYDLRLPRFGLPRFSHGTLVASIATQGREDAAIMAVSEMTTVQSTHLLPRIETLIKSHGVRFTNMSFIFDKQILAYGPHAHRPLQIEALIANTPDTLHIVAAGNGNPISGRGFDVDRHRQPGDLVPAMLPHDNILVVGALDTHALSTEGYPNYRVAGFSNVGELSVDILAPGTRMCGARQGGGTVCEDGTSFAAPYVLNHGVLAVARANPGLTIYKIKEILMKSAYIPNLDDPHPVRSGGILHPQRARATALWLTDHPGASVDSAILAVRRAEMHPLPGEDNSEEYLAALTAFWAMRRIDSKPFGIAGKY